MVLVLNDVTPRLEWPGRDIMKKFKKYNYLTIAENMMELDGTSGELVQKAPNTSSKFKYFARKRKTSS
jgi:hypothetical protein